MIGAAPRPSLRVIALTYANEVARTAILTAAPVGAGLLTLAAAPVLLTVKVGSVLFDLLVLVVCWWLGLDDEEPCYGDGGVA